MFPSIILVATMVLSGATGPGHDNAPEMTVPICSDWQTNSNSDGCADPSGNGIEVNGVRIKNCKFRTEDTELCFEYRREGGSDAFVGDGLVYDIYRYER